MSIVKNKKLIEKLLVFKSDMASDQYYNEVEKETETTSPPPPPPPLPPTHMTKFKQQTSPRPTRLRLNSFESLSEAKISQASLASDKLLLHDTIKLIGTQKAEKKKYRA